MTTQDLACHVKVSENKRPKNPEVIIQVLVVVLIFLLLCHMYIYLYILASNNF